jgi:hypothetical protein
MYEDLHSIAKLRFGKEADAIAVQTQQNVREAAGRYAAMMSPGVQSGQHEASLGRLRIDGAEQLARSLFKIWVDLITQRNGHIGRSDIPFIVSKVNEFINAQKGHFSNTFAQHGGAVASLLAQEGEQRLYTVSANVRRDLEIMVREHEAFRKLSGEKVSMNKTPSRYSVGRRVLFGTTNRVGIVKSVANVPGQMGEFVHELQDAKTEEILPVLGCDIRPFPELDEDLRMNKQIVHIENSNIANLNLGSQIGAINASLQQMSDGDEPQKEFARALQEFTEAVVSATLADDQKKEVVDALSTIAEQAAKKPEERSKGILKAVVAWVPTAIATAHHLTALWDKFGPLIRTHLGI